MTSKEASTGPWWDTKTFLLILVLIVSLPMAFADIPPFIDLPAHLGRYTVELDAGRSSDLARYYEFHWRLIGNLGIDLAIIPFGTIFGLEKGLQILMALTVALSASGLLLIGKQVHGRIPATAMLALLPVYGYFLMFGFLNYCFGLALAYFAFALWLHLTKLRRIVLRSILFLPISLGLWVCHIEAWAVASLMCWLSLIAQHRHAGESYLKASWLAGIACSPFSVALLPMIVLHGNNDEAGISVWFPGFERAKWFVTVVRDRWLLLDLPVAAILYLTAAAALFGVARLRLSAVLALPAAGLFFFFLLLPASFLDTSYAAERLLAPALGLLLLAIDTSRLSSGRQHRLAAATTILFLIAMLAHAWSFKLYDRSFKEQLTAIDQIDRGSAVAVLTGISCQSGLRNWTNSRLAHIAGVATARKHVFTNDQFATKGQQLLDVRYVQAAPFTSVPSAKVSIGPCQSEFPELGVAIDRIPRAAFQYVWLIDIPPGLWPQRSWLQRTWSCKDSVLYRIIP